MRTLFICCIAILSLLIPLPGYSNCGVDVFAENARKDRKFKFEEFKTKNYSGWKAHTLGWSKDPDSIQTVIYKAFRFNASLEDPGVRDRNIEQKADGTYVKEFAPTAIRSTRNQQGTNVMIIAPESNLVGGGIRIDHEKGRNSMVGSLFGALKKLSYVDENQFPLPYPTLVELPTRHYDRAGGMPPGTVRGFKISDGQNILTIEEYTEKTSIYAFDIPTYSLTLVPNVK